MNQSYPSQVAAVLSGYDSQAEWADLSEQDQAQLEEAACQTMMTIGLDRVIACLVGAAVDVSLQYTFAWVARWMDDQPVAFSDYEAVTAQMDASQTAVSAAIACGAAVLPIIPSTKSKLIAAVVAGLGDGAYAMGNHIYVQYDELKQRNPKATIKELFVQLDWKQTLVEGGVNFAITSIATGVVIYAKDNPRFINFAQKLKLKIEADGIESLQTAGLSLKAIEELLEKLGIDKETIRRLLRKSARKLNFSELDIPEAMRHVKYRDLVVKRRKGIGGAHDATEWAKVRKVDATNNPNYKVPTGKTLDQVEEVIVLKDVAHPSVPGVRQIEYKIPAIDGNVNPNVTTGDLRGNGSQNFTKTIYDPTVWTDKKLEQALREAVQDAADRNNGSIPQTNPNFGTTSKGYKVMFTYRDGKITSFWFD